MGVHVPAVGAASYLHGPRSADDALAGEPAAAGRGLDDSEEVGPLLPYLESRGVVVFRARGVVTATG